MAMNKECGSGIMKSRYCMNQIILLLLIMGSVVVPFALASDSNKKIGRLQFTAHADNTFSVVSSGTALGVLLDKIRETTHIDVYTSEVEKKRPVSIDVKKVTLIELLQRVAGDNYAIVFEGQRATDLHLLPKGKTIPDFSGKVQIRDKRARLFFMPADDSKNGVNDYIRKRHEVLEQLAKKDPGKELQAQVSFTGYMTANQIVSFVKSNQLDPVTLNIGWKENGGRYDLKHGESIEAAIESAALYDKEFIAELQESADRQVASLRQKGVGNDQMQSELTFQQNANELASVFHAKGVTFYGVRVATSAKQLHTLTSNDQEIRLVDPLWGGSVEDEVTNAYLTTKIAIPLVPDNEAFIPLVTEDRK